jgi:hypothetical protein
LEIVHRSEKLKQCHIRGEKKSAVLVQFEPDEPAKGNRRLPNIERFSKPIIWPRSQSKRGPFG